MTQRKEPTVLVDTAALTITSMFGKKKKGHADVLASALFSFNKVEKELLDAIETVANEISEEARIAREAEERMKAAQQSGDKLARILQRVKAFTE